MSTDAVYAALEDCQRYYLARRDLGWVPPHLRDARGGLSGPHIGWAPPGWTTTTDHLRSRGHRDDTLLEAGIAVRSRTGGVIDLLRDRMTFPINAERPCAFIGRANPDQPDQLKWINTPSTAIWNKRATLFGVEHGPMLGRGAMPVLVEGPLDALAIDAAATRIRLQALAPCGTALTGSHLDWLSQQMSDSTPVAWCADNDRAGDQAALRAWETMITHPRIAGRQLLHIDVGPHNDPADAYAADPRMLRRQLLHARPLAEKVADLRIDAAGALDHVGTRVALAHHLIAHDLPGVYRHSRARWMTHVAGRLEMPVSELTAMAVHDLTLPSTTRASLPRPEIATPQVSRRPGPATRSGPGMDRGIECGR